MKRSIQEIIIIVLIVFPCVFYAQNIRPCSDFKESKKYFNRVSSLSVGDFNVIVDSISINKTIKRLQRRKKGNVCRIFLYVTIDVTMTLTKDSVRYECKLEDNSLKKIVNKFKDEVIINFCDEFYLNSSFSRSFFMPFTFSLGSEPLVDDGDRKSYFILELGNW